MAEKGRRKLSLVRPPTVPLRAVGTIFSLVSFVCFSATIAEAERPVLKLSRAERGSAALAIPDSRLHTAARRYALSARRLRNILRKDQSVVIDRALRLMYQDAAPSEPPLQADSPEPGSTATSNSLEDPFSLHSAPGSQRTIYLDFDGHTFRNSIWNDMYAGGADLPAPAWDIDGDPTASSAAERAAILEIWQRVSEDYAPFDVNVTTEYPGEDAITRSSYEDQQFGIRVVISPIQPCPDCGGIAPYGSFNELGTYYNSALVFPKRLFNNAKYIAEAISHEVGHTLSLRHDGLLNGTQYYAGHGTGMTGWAPIMGSAYNKALTQWSKGEYPSANNTEDDITRILATGLTYRPDDHGNTRESASALNVESTIRASGVIEQVKDIDVFRLDLTAGDLDVRVAPIGYGANLDAAALLLDSTGQIVSLYGSLEDLSVHVQARVTKGTYYLVVTADSGPGYSDYGSLGKYTLTGSFTRGLTPPIARISSSITHDSQPLVVRFNGSASSDSDGTISSYLWNFGDGSTSTEMNPEHSFSAISSSMTYTVSLTVIDNDGLTNAVTTTISIVANEAPSASFTSAVLDVNSRHVQFDASLSHDSDGEIISYTWDFGDGIIQTTKIPVTTHGYENGGTFTPMLTVKDDRGAQSSISGTEISFLAGTAAFSLGGTVAGANLTAGRSNTTGDFNGDGLTDIVIASSDAFGASLIVRLGEPTGQFGEPTTINLPPHTSNLPAVTSDYNRDGNLDLLTAGNNSVTVVLGNGNGTFAAPISYPIELYAYGEIALADFNSDGRLDVVATAGDGNVRIIFGRPDGSFTTQSTVTLNLGLAAFKLAAGDIDGDGNADFISNSLNGVARIAWGDGFGGFSPSIFADVGGDGALEVADINGDHKMEIFKSNARTGAVDVYTQAAARNFLPPVHYAAPGEAQDLAVVDLDADGYKELVVGSQTLVYMRGKSDGTFDSAIILGEYGFRGNLGISDLNGDGLLDVLFTPLFQTSSGFYLQGSAP